MSIVTYIPMTNAAHEQAVMLMMRSLYREDPAASAPDDSNFSSTIQRLLAKPDSGQIILFLDVETTLHGYAILIPFWSNEFGGVNLFVDELFVRPESRNRGIARGLFDWLRKTRPFDAKLIALEVSPTNTNARRLYESQGFEARRYTMMTLLLK